MIIRRQRRVAILFFGIIIPSQLLAVDDTSSPNSAAEVPPVLVDSHQHQHLQEKEKERRQQETNHNDNSGDDHHVGTTTMEDNDLEMNDGIDPIPLRPSHHEEGRKLHDNEEFIDDTIRQNQEEVLTQHDDELKITTNRYILSSVNISSSSSSNNNRDYSNSNEQIFDDGEDKEEGDSDEDDTNTMSATQTVHEDALFGFRLPDLSQVIVTNDDNDQQMNSVNSYLVGNSSSSIQQSNDETPEADEKIAKFGIESIIHDIEVVVEVSDDYTKIKTKTNHDNKNNEHTVESYEKNIDDAYNNIDAGNNEQQHIDDVVVLIIEDENLVQYNPTGITSTEEKEVEDDEVVVVSEKENNLVGYRTIGITNTDESVVEEEEVVGVVGHGNNNDDDDTNNFDIHTTINESINGSASSARIVEEDTNNSHENGEKMKRSDSGNDNDDGIQNVKRKEYDEASADGVTETKLTVPADRSNDRDIPDDAITTAENTVTTTVVASTKEIDQHESLEQIKKKESVDLDITVDNIADGETSDPNSILMDDTHDGKHLTLDQLSETNGKNESDKKEETSTTPIDDDDEDLTHKVSVDYASKSAGALIIEKTSEFKGTSNLMINDRDKYAIVPCSEERKYVVLSLSEDILVKVIKLANYERFSSMVKGFQVKGSHTLGNWVDLGTYRAENRKGEQIFTLNNPTWARYLKFKFLSHHGVEYYCTLSQIQVHGSNMVQGFHEQWESIEVNNGDYEDRSDDITRKIEEGNLEREAGESIHMEAHDDNWNESKSSDEDIKNPNISVSDVDAIIGEEYDLQNADAIPSVDAQTNPNPLGHFRFHSSVSAAIKKRRDGNQNLFSNLYDVIPRNLSSLPSHPRNSIGRKNRVNTERGALHQLIQLAKSLNSFGSPLVSETISIFATKSNYTSIVSPKMDDYAGYIQKIFGNGVLSMMDLNFNSSTINRSNSVNRTSQNEITENNRSLDENMKISTKPIERLLDAVPEDKLNKSLKSPAKTHDSTSGRKLDSAHVVEMNDYSNLEIASLLKYLPNSDCLINLDYATFKAKVSTARKAAATSGSPQTVGMMEPIFKKLTDEIFALQTTLSIHDQFTKTSVSCYQSVILDLAMEVGVLRQDQEERLLKLEEQIAEPASMRMLKKILTSVLRSMIAWFILNGSKTFLLVKKITISIIKSIAAWFVSNGPKMFLFAKNWLVRLTDENIFSKDTNIFTNLASHHLVDKMNGLFETFRFKSNGWSESAKYRDFFSTWSTYYDGGKVVAATVLILLICRLIMFCSSMRKQSAFTSRKKIYSRKHDGSKRLEESTSNKNQKKRSNKNRMLKSRQTQMDHSRQTSEKNPPKLHDETNDKCNGASMKNNIHLILTNDLKMSEENSPEALMKDDINLISTNDLKMLEENSPEAPELQNRTNDKCNRAPMKDDMNLISTNDLQISKENSPEPPELEDEANDKCNGAPMKDDMNLISTNDLQISKENSPEPPELEDEAKNNCNGAPMRGDINLILPTDLKMLEENPSEL